MTKARGVRYGNSKKTSRNSEEAGSGEEDYGEETGSGEEDYGEEAGSGEEDYGEETGSYNEKNYRQQNSGYCNREEAGGALSGSGFGYEESGSGAS